MAFRLSSKKRDLGGFSVRRILPHPEQRTVGPFVFFDHMGPAEFEPGEGISVRPHPHIGLATLTYLLEGSILHRDSLGSVQEIFPGDVNWMIAGRGIVHSERETLEVHASRHRAHGFQFWLALPPEHEDTEPAFFHFPRNALPHVMRDGLSMRLVAGTAYGRASPVRTFSPMYFIDVIAPVDRVVERPDMEGQAACYVQSGEVEIGGARWSAGDFVVFGDDDREITVIEAGRLMLLGGLPFDPVPHIEWNFVSHDPQRIRAARERWIAGGFPVVPGDEEEWIPLE